MGDSRPISGASGHMRLGQLLNTSIDSYIDSDQSRAEGGANPSKSNFDRSNFAAKKTKEMETRPWLSLTGWDETWHRL
ncbi:hypothetical protein RRG08_002165 [Elysia crispata]|uniref:Uncharacterized protein n=1 Tax=Elysia crispata TaxID=231223 RepID=A0AAE0ZAL2_9GAST|nr:hypothetical protein RRG08_002165 [Elysia crispata]